MGRIFTKERYNTNPFLEALDLRTGKKLRKEVVVSSGDGEVTGALVSRNIRDTEPFVKYFDFRAGWWYRQLSRNGFLVREFIMTRLQRDTDYVSFSIHDLMKWSGLGKTSCYEGLREMIKGGVIEPSDVDCRWWINPKLFFNGDRSKLVKKKYEKRSSQKIRRVVRPDAR